MLKSSRGWVCGLLGGGEGLLLRGEVVGLLGGLAGLGAAGGGGGGGGVGLVQQGPIQVGLFFLWAKFLSRLQVKCSQPLQAVHSAALHRPSFVRHFGQVYEGPGFCSMPALINRSLSMQSETYLVVRISKNMTYQQAVFCLCPGSQKNGLGLMR